MATSTGSHLQAKFFTKQNQYKVAETPFSVPASVEVPDLSALINKLLQEDISDREFKTVEFDFLITDEFLRVPLGEHLENNGISTETVIEIEYLERHPSPEPVGSILHEDWVSAVKGSVDTILTGSYDHVVRLWDTKGELLTTLPYHTGPVKTVAWIAQGEQKCLLASGSHDQTLLIWEWDKVEKTARCIYCCRGHARSVDSIAVDKQQTRICSGSFDKMLKVWSAVSTGEEEPPDIEQERKKAKSDAHKPQTRTPLITLEGHKEAVSSVMWIDNNEVCSASWDHTMLLWDLTTGAQTSTLTGTKAFLCIDYSEHSRLIASGSVDRHVRIWDPRQSEATIVKASLTHHIGWISSVVWSPSNPHQLLSGSYDKHLKMWDIRSPKAPLYDMTGILDKILAVDWSIPELLLCGSADNNVHMFHTSEIGQYSTENLEKMDR